MLSKDMKLQRQLSRKTKDKVYDKWVIVIPPKKIKEAELKEGDELKIEAGKGKLILTSI